MAQTIPSGSQSTPFSATTADTYTLNAGETRTQTAGAGVTTATATGAINVDIEGTLTDTATGQVAINTNNPGGGQLTVGTGGAVRSLNGNTIVEQSANATVNLINLGQIIATTSPFTPSVGGANPGTAFAVTYNAARGAAGAAATDFTSGGTIQNGSATNTTALIRSDNGDAIRLGSHETLINYGQIVGNGPVNDASTNNSFNSTAAGGNGNPNTSTATTYDISRGVRINQNNATSVVIENHNLIQGAQHGVDVGVAGATGLVVNNLAGATILGRNGSGVGADTTGVALDTVTVNNYGTIRGEYAPGYDRAGYATVDGDGDGVDIDGAATVSNYAGGLIAGSGANGNLAGQGAGGFDSNGRANRSEGLSLGGGRITNDGTISGADTAIVVNNDSNADGSRSGVLATSLVNGASGRITGQNGYAIRLENKTGTALIDNDTIVNAGTITGNGTIPAGTVNRQDGNPDPGTVGTLDGTTYTAAANAGSARFIAGDGSAIQTGEGADTLSNYGTITGNTGRALNLEGGDDTLNLYTGSTVGGRIDGGAGTDTLALRLDDRPATAASGLGSLGANSGATTGSLVNVVNFERLAVQGGTWTIGDAQGYSAGVTIAGGAGLTVGASGALAGDVADAGTLTFARSGDLDAAGTISGQGSLVQAGTGTLRLTNAANSYSGGTTIRSGTLDLAAAGATGTGAIAFGTLTGTATARLALEIAAQPTTVSFANTIGNFGTGSQLDLAGLRNAALVYAPGSGTDPGLLTVTGYRAGSATPLTQTYRFASPSSNMFTAQDDGAGGTLITVCYCSGTGIRLVRRGSEVDVPVENLRIGDVVVTASGAHRPIRWIGHRAYAGRFANTHPGLLPIRVAAGALADGVPARDLTVSPKHALYLDGVLIPAEALVNGTSVVKLQRVDDLTYWHVELDSHDVILAENTPAESFVDDEGRGIFHNARTFRALYPDAAECDAVYCAPRVESGPVVAAVRARIAGRAGLDGAHPMTFGALRGHVDACANGVVSGWAQDMLHPDAPVCLDVLIDGAPVALIYADLPRPDLAAAGMGHRCHGFRFELPPGTEAARVLEVRRSADGAALPAGPVVRAA